MTLFIIHGFFCIEFPMRYLFGKIYMISWKFFDERFAIKRTLAEQARPGAEATFGFVLQDYYVGT